MGSFQTQITVRSSGLLENSCGYLLQELQTIWDEVGEDQFEREKVLLDIEQECLEVYRRKVDYANMARSRLHQELAESEAEFTHLLLSLGQQSLPERPEKKAGTLKQQLDSITPALREMRLRKRERMNQFRAVQGQIQKILAEIAGRSEYDDSTLSVIVNENDLSLKKLEEYQAQLQKLQNDKSNRLQRVEQYLSTIHELSAVLGMDSSMIITKIHPSLNELCGIAKNISDCILSKLDSTVKSLEEEKHKRLEKLHHLGKSLEEMWSLMDTAEKDRQLFSHVTNLLSVSSAEIQNRGSLTLNIIQQAEAEVKRLDQLKASKMKELFLRKQFELEEICSKSHMDNPSRSDIENVTNLLESGEIDPANLLSSMDEQISKAKEEACSRKAIMEKVEKWMLARDEERWLEEYNRDENRYSVSRGAHKNLKRAERARITVSKIPALVDMLIGMTRSWEDEHGKTFLYDQAPLLEMLEEYNSLWREREEEKQKQRVSINRNTGSQDRLIKPLQKKKVQSQAPTEQENAFSTRPGTSSRHTPIRSLNVSFSASSPLSRRLSTGFQQIGSYSINAPGQGTPFAKKGKKIHARPSFASQLREETASVVSNFSGPLTPDI